MNTATTTAPATTRKATIHAGPAAIRRYPNGNGFKWIINIPRTGITVVGDKVEGQATLPLSSSGKTMSLATTNGFKLKTEELAPSGQPFIANANIFVYPDRKTGAAPDLGNLPGSPANLDVLPLGPAITVTKEMVAIAFDDNGQYAEKPEEGKKMVKAAYVSLRDIPGATINGVQIGGNVFVGFYPAR